MTGLPGGAHPVGQEYHQQSLLFLLGELGEEILQDGQELPLHGFVAVLRVAAQPSCERFQLRVTGRLGDLRIGLLEPSGQEGCRVGEFLGDGFRALPGEGVCGRLGAYGGEQFLHRGTVLVREFELDGGGDGGTVRKAEFLRLAQLLCAGVLCGREVDRVLVAYCSCRRGAQGGADTVGDLVTGIRKGEALGLHWNDVHLDRGVLYVRCRLSAIDNHLVITTPRTRSSRGWIAISLRVTTALRRRARSVSRTRGSPSDPFTGLVFCRPAGRPLGPHLVLDWQHQLSEEAGVPRVTVHELRHLAATITVSISTSVPLTVVSKTLRHSTLSTTANF